MKVSVPGKLVLLGEYAVLNGSPALVAAVNRNAAAHQTKAPLMPRIPSRVVEAVCAQAGRRAEAPEIDIDSSTFYHVNGEKLGIGSSAAAAVSTAILLRGQADEQALCWALDGHRAAAGGVGSGIDVLACFHGGVLATRMQPSAHERFPISISSLHLAVFYLQKSVATKSMVFATQTCDEWSALTKDMAETATRGIEAWRNADAKEFLASSKEYGLQMLKLGQAASVPVVTDEMMSLMEIASEYGAAAKPSGAGGGDVALVWALEEEVLDRIEKRSSVPRVSISLNAQGARCVGT